MMNKSRIRNITITLSLLIIVFVTAFLMYLLVTEGNSDLTLNEVVLLFTLSLFSYLIPILGSFICEFLDY